MPAEDWFESSLPAEEASGANAMEAGERAQPAQVSLGGSLGANIGGNLEVDPGVSLKLSSRLDGGFLAGAIASERQSSVYGADFETVPVQPSTTVPFQLSTAGTAFAKAAPGWRQAEWPGIQSGDQLMKEIPLLIAQVPAEPQRAPVSLRLAAVVVEGALMLGAVLMATLAVTLNGTGLPEIKEIALGAAAALFILGVLCQMLFRRWTRRRRGAGARS
jgi:hypothetical protein